MPDNNKRKMVSFVGEGEKFQTSPIGFFDRDINGIDKFAILKTTDGGKWLRGKMLYYKINGVEIYTEENNVIFVDLKQNIVFIKEYSKAIEEINPTDPEERQYIILFRDLGYKDEDNITLDSDEFPLRWEAVIGRRATYETIKANAPVIDIDKSYVLVETVAFKDALTVRGFMTHMTNANIIEDEGFDITDYDNEYF